MQLAMHGAWAVMRGRELDVGIHAFHDPALEVELEVVHDEGAPVDALGELWFLASDDVVAATEAVWLPPAEARLSVPARLALIGACVATLLGVLAATL